MGTLVKLAQDRGWTVQVIATPAALEFFDEAAIQEETGNPVRSQGISDTYALGVLAEATGLRVPIVVLPFVSTALGGRVPFRRSHVLPTESACPCPVSPVAPQARNLDDGRADS